MSKKIVKYQTPSKRMTDAERRELEERLAENYVNGAATVITISEPLLDVCGDFKLAHIAAIIRNQIIYNAERGKCVHYGYVWCKLGYRAISILSGNILSEKEVRLGVEKLEELGLIRRRIVYNAEAQRYESAMYALTDLAMLLTGTNPELATFASKIDSSEFVPQELTEAEKNAVPADEIEEAKHESKPSKPEKKPAKAEKKAAEKKPVDIEHGYVLIQSVMFPFVPERYKYIAADLDGDDRRDADAAMEKELKKRHMDSLKNYLK